MTWDHVPQTLFPQDQLLYNCILFTVLWLKIAKVHSNGLKQKEGETLIKDLRKFSLGKRPMWHWPPTLRRLARGRLGPMGAEAQNALLLFLLFIFSNQICGCITYVQ